MNAVVWSIPSPPSAWAAFQVGPLTVHTYALCILTGMIAAILISGRRLAARGVPAGFAVDAAIWAVPFGLVGARLYHVFTHTGDYFHAGANLWLVFAIWDGGNALYGSLIGGAVGAWIACRRAGVRLWTFADALAPGLLIAQAVGRLGNWFNHELFGLPTTLPWGLQIEASNPAIPAGTPAGTLFQPLFLYELLWNLIGAGLLVLAGRRFRLQWGKVFGLYLIWYGIARAGLEAIRLDPTSDRLFDIPANDWGSFVAITLGVLLFAVQTLRHPGPEPSPYSRPPAIADAGGHDEQSLEPAARR
ncbi:prolipoprotein diacylglyceryl transferase [Amnibacterium soli]|uniref:Phosphatidylglycerol--prolipoprotein diacylglyceryl transferase n=1 Tax=Amnibacterium soli TaxID=1282736 RepID=A0ABP8ZET2_9MICO